jgi:hypothetical protein
LSNELPRLADASGALAKRFITLVLKESFYGREDHGLAARLIAELPGILNWALDGWARLAKRGHFVQPASSNEVTQEFEDLGSPIGAFCVTVASLGKGGPLKWMSYSLTGGLGARTTVATGPVPNKRSAAISGPPSLACVCRNQGMVRTENAFTMVWGSGQSKTNRRSKIHQQAKS